MSLARWVSNAVIVLIHFDDKHLSITRLLAKKKKDKKVSTHIAWSVPGILDV
jgi:hypothetical protein